MDGGFSIWTTLFSIIASQGLLIGVLICWKKKDYRRLGVAILLFTILLSYYILFWTGQLSSFPAPLGIVMGFPYLIATAILMQTGQFRLNRLLVLLIPFWAYCSFYFVSQMWSFPAWTHGLQAAVQCSVMLAYGIWSLRISTNYIDRRVSQLFLGFTAAHTSYFLMLWLNLLTPENDYYVSLIGALFIYASGYLVFFFKPRARRVESDELHEKMRNMLIERIEEDRLYLDNELRLPTLAKATGFSTHQISELINSGGERFTDLINRYRVNEAQRLLTSLEGEKMSTEEVGYASGFNNKTSFYKHFKKATGMSPMKYRTSQGAWIAK